MKIELKAISVRDIVNGYTNSDEDGVFWYGGILNIRPIYQREFIYNEKQRNAVIDTLRKDFPLNVMYWSVNHDGTFEVLDGQQRTLSVCEYVKWKFSLGFKYFHNLQEEDKEKILNYKFMVYFCEWANEEKLEWFRTINIAGAELTEQELRNAVYTWAWLTDAKRHFSKTGCPAYGLARKYMVGSPIRQKYLETVLSWISNGEIREYMAIHQFDPNAAQLWLYFQNVMSWTKVTFKKERKEMEGICWGQLYNDFKDTVLDPDAIEAEVSKLMADDCVDNKKGIYEYVLRRKEKFLNVRAFTSSEKRGAYERQDGTCPSCSEKFPLEEMEGDHITPWHEGGKTTAENCQMLCKECNRRKSGK